MDSNPFRHFDLNLLVSLHTLLEYKNVTHAAHAMHLSQPALSAQLAKLRALFNDPLLIPASDGKGMLLTEKAEALIRPLKKMMDHLHTIHDTEPYFNPEQDQRIFKIIVSDSASVSIVTPLIEFIGNLPNNKLQIKFVQHYSNKITQQLEQDDVDLVIDLENNLPENFPSRLLIDEDFVLCFGQKHALKDKHTITIDEYCALEHIVVGTSEVTFVGYTDDILHALGYKRQVQHSIYHFLLAVECLQNTNYVCILPRHLAERPNFNLKFLELPFHSARYRLRMVWHPKKQNNPAIQWLREEIAQLVRQNQHKLLETVC